LKIQKIQTKIKNRKKPFFLKIIKIKIMWKNYYISIFWGFYHMRNIFKSHRISWGHPSLDYSGLSTLNFSILFAWTIPNISKFLLILLSYQSS
jgi:hypothetical protein